MDESEELVAMAKWLPCPKCGCAAKRIDEQSMFFFGSWRCRYCGNQFRRLNLFNTIYMTAFFVIFGGFGLLILLWNMSGSP